MQGIATREPGGAQLGAQLRALLLDPTLQTTPWAEACLFEAGRAQTYTEIIVPEIRVGRVALSDRNGYGTIAYQGFGRGLPMKLIDEMNATATLGSCPDLILLMDIDPRLRLRRKRELTCV